MEAECRIRLPDPAAARRRRAHRGPEQGGRKTYALTEAGRAVAEEAADTPAPWEGPVPAPAERSSARCRRPGVDLAGAVAQVARTGSPEQVQQAIEVLEEARRKLYAILAD